VLVILVSLQVFSNTPLHLFQVYNVILEFLKIHVLGIPVSGKQKQM